MLEQLLKEYTTLEIHKQTKPLTKLTRVVMNNDGSMTKTLQNILEQDIQIQVLNEEQSNHIPYHIRTTFNTELD